VREAGIEFREIVLMCVVYNIKRAVSCEIKRRMAIHHGRLWEILMITHLSSFKNISMRRLTSKLKQREHIDKQAGRLLSIWLTFLGFYNGRSCSRIW